MQRIFCALVATLFSLGFASACLADEPAADEGAGLGYYIGGGALYALEDFDSGLDGGNSWGLSVRAGSRTNQHVAFGIVADYYHGFDSNLGDLDGFSIFPVMNYYPLIGEIEPYATLGLGIYRLAGDNDAFGPGDDEAIDVAARLGLGVDVHVSEHVALFVDAAYLVADKRNLGDLQAVPITLGATYRP